MATLVGHTEEVLDVCFDVSGQLIATASADGETIVFYYKTYFTSLMSYQETFMTSHTK